LNEVPPRFVQPGRVVLAQVKRKSYFILPQDFSIIESIAMKISSVRRTVLAAMWIFIFGSLSFTQPKTLTILHTNDIHASFLPHEAFWLQTTPKPYVGGFTELWWTVDSIRKVKNDVLMLDGGDVMTGTPISDIPYQGAEGGGLFQMMNIIGYDAWTIGNHDLDISQENLRKLTAIAKFPTISANLTDSSGNFVLNNKDYLILNKNGLRIGIIGLMTMDLFNVTNTNNLHGLKVNNVTEVTQKLIDKISPETDLLVVLSHEGVDDDSMLAATTHGLNVIIGGHSHTRLKVPKVVNGVLICQTGSNLENLGELELTVENHKVTSYHGKLISLWARNDRPENEMSKFVDSFKDKIDKEYSEVLGTISEDWKRTRGGESNLGTFISEALREHANADIGVTNSSGIRKDLSAGNVRKMDLYEIAPFRNVLCTFPISGKEIRVLVDRYLHGLIDGHTSIDLAGVTCTWKRDNGEPKIQSIKIGGSELEDGRQYNLATSDFIVNQKEKYIGMVPPNVNYTTTTVFHILAEKVAKEKSIDAKTVMHFQEIQ